MPNYIINLSTIDPTNIYLPNTEQGLQNGSAITIRTKNGARNTIIYGTQNVFVTDLIYWLGNSSPSNNYTLNNNFSATFLYYGRYWYQLY
jgi:hypothetical protein